MALSQTIIRRIPATLKFKALPSGKKIHNDPYTDFQSETFIFGKGAGERNANPWTAVCFFWLRRSMPRWKRMAFFLYIRRMLIYCLWVLTETSWTGSNSNGSGLLEYIYCWMTYLWINSTTKKKDISVFVGLIHQQSWTQASNIWSAAFQLERRWKQWGDETCDTEDWCL